MNLIEKTNTPLVPFDNSIAGNAENPPFVKTFLAAAATSVEVPLDSSWVAWPERLPLQQPLSTSRARFPIYRAREPLQGIPVLCQGWAARVCRFPDGRRQILSFVLPGELMSINAVFADQLNFYVEAITEVIHSYYDRQYFDNSLRHDGKLLRALAGSCLAEKEEIEQQVANLGRRRAEERIAHLFLHLMVQMDRRGLVQNNNSFNFPLRQQHIADATGLTVVHANRVIGAFRNEGLIEVANGVLWIHDVARLRRVAD